MQDAPREFQITVFPALDTTILPAAQKLVQRLKENRYYTDTASFDLRCQVGRGRRSGRASMAEVRGARPRSAKKGSRAKRPREDTPSPPVVSSGGVVVSRRNLPC